MLFVGAVPLPPEVLKVTKLLGHGAFLLLISGALSLFPGLAQADEQDVFNVIAGVSWQHDNNLFLLPSGVDTKFLTGRPERWDNKTSAFAGFRIDKPYSLQRFQLDYTQTAYRYQNYKFLDVDANEYRVAWLWSLSPYLTGNLSTESKQSLSSFQDYRNFTNFNLVTTVIHRFDADWSPHGNWHLLGGVSQNTSNNSQAFNAIPSYSQDEVQGGVKYIFQSGSSLVLMGHDRQGGYDGNRQPDAANLYDSGFGEQEGDAILDWVLSGKSRLNVKAAYVSREHDHFSQRDYAQPFGSINYTWMPTGKLQVLVTASRDIGTYQLPTSSYTLNDALSLSPVWTISDKLTLQGAVSVSSRKFRGDGIVGAPVIDREDTGKLASLALSWKPWRSVTISSNLQHSSRSSTQSGFDFSDTTAGVSSQIFF